MFARDDLCRRNTHTAAFIFVLQQLKLLLTGIDVATVLGTGINETVVVPAGFLHCYRQVTITDAVPLPGAHAW